MTAKNIRLTDLAIRVYGEEKMNRRAGLSRLLHERGDVTTRTIGAIARGLEVDVSEVFKSPELGA